MIKLPKEYLSWSQINLVLSRPNDYVAQYITKEKVFNGNVYTDFGSYIHDNIEQGNVPRKIPSLPMYEQGEVKTYATLFRGENELTVMGFFDGLTLGSGHEDYTDVIGEYKTGGQLWSYNKAFKHGQNKLYSIMHKTVNHFIPRHELVSVETEFSDETKTQLRLTGRMRVHKVQYTYEELKEFERDVVWKAADKITELMEIYG